MTTQILSTSRLKEILWSSLLRGESTELKREDVDGDRYNVTYEYSGIRFEVEVGTDGELITQRTDIKILQ